jgi:hypothetical protein
MSTTPPLDPSDSTPEPEQTAQPAAAADTTTAPHADGAHPHHHHKKKKKTVRIEHKVPGRIRMKIPSAKDNPEFLATFQQVFATIPGVSKVHPKPDTGSIVIHYDPLREAEFEQHFHHHCAQQEVAVHSELPGNEINDIAKKIEAEAEFLAERSEAVRHTVDFCRKLDRQIRKTTDNTIDLKIVLVGGLAAATFVEIGMAAATPMWVTLSLFAMNHVLELKQEGRPGTAPQAQAQTQAQD